LQHGATFYDAATSRLTRVWPSECKERVGQRRCGIQTIWAKMNGKNREGNLILEPIDALKYFSCVALITLRSTVVNFCAPSFFIFHVPCFNQIQIFFKEITKNELETIHVILLHNNHRHVCATHAAIFWVITTTIQLFRHINCNCILVLTTLKMVT